MSKSTFKFVFPKISKEYEALVNPMHIQAATALIMAENNADLCMVFFSEQLQFFCTYDGNDYDKPFRYYYEDKSAPNDVYVLYDYQLVQAYHENGFDLAAAEKTVEQCNVYKGCLKNRTFSTGEEVDAYVSGFNDAMEMTGHEDDYTFLSEDEYDVFYDAAQE